MIVNSSLFTRFRCAAFIKAIGPNITRTIVVSKNTRVAIE